MNDKKKRAVTRWRKAKDPNIGTRWNTPMNRFVWDRDHGRDIELWRGEKHIATVNTETLAWRVEVGPTPRSRGRATSLDLAKAAAKEAAESVPCTS